MKLRNYINIALIIIWMITIFAFSNQNSDDSTSLSDKVIIKIAEIGNKELTLNEEEKLINKYHLITRKTAHFLSYFILSTLIIILLLDLKIPKKYVITLIFCFFYACTDEFHQLFINGRNGSLIDVLIDTVGAISSLLLIYLITILKKNHIKNN